MACKKYKYPSTQYNIHVGTSRSCCPYSGTKKCYCKTNDCSVPDPCSFSDQCSWTFPENTVFVAKNWIGGVKNHKHQFTSIQEAIDFVKFCYPDRRLDSRVGIYIYPGSYSENVVMDHNIDLIGFGNWDVAITSISYTTNSSITFGVDQVYKNLSVGTITLDRTVIGTNGFLRVTLDSVWLTKNPSLQINGPADVFIYDSHIFKEDYDGIIIYQTDRAKIYVYSSDVGARNYMSNGSEAYYYGCEVGNIVGNTSQYAVNLDGECKVSFSGCIVYGLDLQNDSYCMATGTKFQNKQVSVDATSTLSAPNCSFTVQATGAGVKDITVQPFNVTTTGATLPVSNQFNFSDTNYSISWTQTSGTPTVPIIANITNSSFDITGPNGAVYRITVAKINNADTFP